MYFALKNHEYDAIKAKLHIWKQ